MSNTQHNPFFTESEAKFWMEAHGTQQVTARTKDMAANAWLSLTNLMLTLHPEMTPPQARAWVLANAIRIEPKEGRTLQEIKELAINDRTAPFDYFNPQKKPSSAIKSVQIHEAVVPLLGVISGRKPDAYQQRLDLTQELKDQPKTSVAALAAQYDVDEKLLFNYISSFWTDASIAFNTNLLSPTKTLDFWSYAHNAFITAHTDNGQKDIYLSPLAVLLADLPAFAKKVHAGLIEAPKEPGLPGNAVHYDYLPTEKNAQTPEEMYRDEFAGREAARRESLKTPYSGR